MNWFAQAICTCGDICPYYNNLEHKGQCWENSKECGRTPPNFCARYREEFCLNIEPCAGWCSCNFFGCNCEACGDCSDSTRHRLRGRNTLDAQPPQQQQDGDVSSSPSLCTDYNYYMSLTLDEKLAHLESRICQTSRRVLQAKADIVSQVEAAADSNGDGTLTCEEFNNAEANLVEASNLCQEIL